MNRRHVLLGLGTVLAGAAGATGAATVASAQDEWVSIVDSHPKAQAVIGEPGSNFFVRFDRPIDHERSNLSIWQGDRMIERLAPSLDANPQVLYARAPTLPNGTYRLHWAVRTLSGRKELQGDIEFVVNMKR